MLGGPQPSRWLYLHSGTAGPALDQSSGRAISYNSKPIACRVRRLRERLTWNGLIKVARRPITASALRLCCGASLPIVFQRESGPFRTDIAGRDCPRDPAYVPIQWASDDQRL